MKNVQLVTTARVCELAVFEVTDEEFRLIFPEEGQDIEIYEDVYEQLGDERATAVFHEMFKREKYKTKVHGIHGTVYKGNEYAGRYFPTKKSDEMIRIALPVVE